MRAFRIARLIVFAIVVAASYLGSQRNTPRISAPAYGPASKLLASEAPTRTDRTPISFAVATDTPTATRTPRPTRTPRRTSSPTIVATATVTPSVIAGYAITSMGSVRHNVPTPTPGAVIVTTDLGIEWVRYADASVSLLYPDGWLLEAQDKDIFVAAEDYTLGIWWIDSADDLEWLFYGNNQKSRHVSNMLSEMEKQFFDSLNASLGTVENFSKFEQEQLGEFLTFGEVAYEVKVTNNWDDADALYFARAVARCGNSRLCYFTYQKIDRPITQEDWELLDYFAGTVKFVDENGDQAEESGGE